VEQKKTNGEEVNGAGNMKKSSQIQSSNHEIEFEIK
jgi:hypothetical protein